MKPMNFITNKQSKQRHHNNTTCTVYGYAIRCYLIYLLVVITILVAPTDSTTVPVTGENTTEREVNQSQVNNLLVSHDIYLNTLNMIKKRSILQETSYIVSSESEEELTNVTEEIEPTVIVQDNENDILPEETIEDIEEEPVEELPDYNYNQVTSSTSVKGSSGLTAQQIDTLLEGTDLYGIGQAVYEVEQTNGINAYFTISVASLESGYGSSDLAKNKNNIFGMINCSFDSFDSCVAYFGKLMNDYEYKHNITMTTEGINPRYCELDSWTGKVVSLMNRYIREANELY